MVMQGRILGGGVLVAGYGLGGQYRVEGFPIVFIVLPFFGLTFWDPTYKSWFNQKELQWRL